MLTDHLKKIRNYKMEPRMADMVRVLFRTVELSLHATVGRSRVGNVGNFSSICFANSCKWSLVVALLCFECYFSGSSGFPQKLTLKL